MSELRPVLERLREELTPKTDASTQFDSLRKLKQRRSVKRRLTAGLVASVVGLAGVGFALSAFDVDRDAPVREASPPVLDPRIVTNFPVGPRGQVGGIAAGFGSLWVTAYGVDGGGGPDDAALLRIDPATNRVTDEIPLEGVSPWETGGGGVAVGWNAIWVAGYFSGDGESQGALYRIDPESLDVEGILLGGEIAAPDVAVSDDGIWVTGQHDGVATLTHVDPRFGKIDFPEVPLRGETARQVVATDHAVVVRQWEWDGNQGPCDVLTSIDPRTVAPIAEEPRGKPCTGSGAADLFVWGGQVWTSISTGFTQLDPGAALPTGAVVPFTKEGASPRSHPVVDEHGVWFGAYPGGNGSSPDRLSLLDPATGTIDTFELQVGWSAAAVLDGTLWALGWDGSVTRIDLLGDPDSDPNVPVEPSGPPPVPASPVSLWLSADTVPPGPVELVGILVNHDGVDVTFGVAATVDRWDGDEWIPHGQVVMCMDHWHCTSRIEPAGGDDAVPAIGLAPSVGNPGPVERFTTDGLEVGWYRISQVANEGITASAIFEVAGSAPEPAPLVSVEAPAISVTPALLPTSGAPIHLYPLIPAPSGSQSREDIERAIAGLSEIALIERWDGAGWEPAGEVQLHEIQGDSLPRSAELPPLAEGAYRLVRRGPGVDHVGHFWVDAAAGVVTVGG